jgi:quinoprotein glucose dehydrogenase
MRLLLLTALLAAPATYAVTAEAPAAGAVPPAMEKALAGIKLPAGYRAAPFAADHQLGNPVTFCLDDQGRVYVAETYRFEDGVSDNRQSGFWLDDDLAAQTVEDRLAYYRKHAARRKPEWYTRHADQVRRLEDRDGDGRAEVSAIFAPGFNAPEDGLGSGLIARDGAVWYTNIPHLWRLRDADGDGVAESREKLLSGFGVRTAFLGHDLHGLAWGPDGRLYWSIGDRGYHVATREGTTLSAPGRGAVFRAEPDGSCLEVFHHGLRNPQELAFNELGDLFTGDNNSDSGDRARIVYLMEGGDAGWNMEYQYMEGDYSRGPFNAEKVWHPLSDDNRAARPAATLPPLMNLGNGPSGLAFAPGASFGAAYRDHFFLCDYTGSPPGSKIWTFRVEGAGAGYRVVDPKPFLEHVCATDVDFAADGRMFVSDWITGWKGSGKGRLYTVTPEGWDPARAAAARARFAENRFATAPVTEVAGWLGDDDPRVRQRAQFALAGRGAEGQAALTRVAGDAEAPRLARFHAIWGLGQIARSARSPAAVEPVAARFLADPDAEFRTQGARALGEARAGGQAAALVARLADASPRVRAAAALALGRIGHPPAFPALAALLRENDNHDVFLRHAAVMGLVGARDPEGLLRLARDPSPAVRLGVLLALRRLGDARVAGFLGDPQSALVAEAARAVYDDRHEAALPALSALLAQPPSTDGALLRRAIGAATRTGDAAALARFAARAESPAALRRVALRALEKWTDPSPRDPVNGQWRPLPKRPAADVAVALQPVMGALLRDGDKQIAEAAAGLSGKFGVPGDDPDAFVAWAADAQRDIAVRQAALRALVESRHPRAGEAVRTALRDPQEALRATGLGLLATANAAVVLPEIDRVLASGGTLEKQAAYTALTGLQTGSAEAAARVRQGFAELAAGRAGPTWQLEILLAARAAPDPALRAEAAAWEARQAAAGPTAPYAFAREGGDAARGEAVFRGHPAAQCTRCHVDGGGIGPDLRGVGSRLDRTALLAGIVDPNAAIAPGFGAISITRRDGRSLTGVLKAESAERVTVLTPEGESVDIPRAEITAQTPPLSVMPPMGSLLAPGELRDLVEFLAQWR